jgi:membrane protease YdiL (CAAX protease family)
MEYIRQALKGKNDWWRTFIICLIFSLIFGLSFLMMANTSPEDLQKAMSPTGNKNIDLVIMLSQFGFMLGLLFLLFYFLHQRSLVALTTARAKIDFKRVFFAISTVIILQVVLFGFSYAYDSSDIVWNFDASKFITLVIICILLLPIQIGFEEYLFRGYLMQQIGIATKSVWTPLIITSVLFGLMHISNPEVSEMGLKIMVFYIGTGLFMGIMTLLDDGLELALGFHFANNFMAAILMTTDFSALQTDAMFKYVGEGNSESLFNETLLSMLITYPLILIIFGKVYKWNWKALSVR